MLCEGIVVERNFRDTVGAECHSEDNEQQQCRNADFIGETVSTNTDEHYECNNQNNIGQFLFLLSFSYGSPPFSLSSGLSTTSSLSFMTEESLPLFLAAFSGEFQIMTQFLHCAGSGYNTFVLF